MIDVHLAVYKSLNSHGVKYLVIGGVALILHGYPRATADVDIIPIWNATRSTRYLKRLI